MSAYYSSDQWKAERREVLTVPFTAENFDLWKARLDDRTQFIHRSLPAKVRGVELDAGLNILRVSIEQSQYIPA